MSLQEEKTDNQRFQRFEGFVLMARLAIKNPLVLLLEMEVSPFLPLLIPPIIVNHVSKGEHRIDIGTGPLHPCSFQTGLQYALVSTFHHPRSNGPSGSLIAWVLHLRLALEQIAQIALQGCRRPKALDQPAQVFENSAWPFVFEPMQDAKKPVRRKMPSTRADLLADLIEIFGCVIKVENTDGIVPVLIDKSLQPHRSILDRTHPGGLVDPSSAHFPSTQFRKRFCIGEPGEDAMVARPPLLRSFPGCGGQ
jgi:hypothetical protein